MDCVNHSGVTATAYCQNCGKALCADCIRQTGPGQVLCDSCIQTRQQAWQGAPHPFAAPNPFGVPPPSGPNPAVAAILGFIPGVGAMYNGQFAKGLVHVLVFAVLVSITSRVHSDLDIFFGLLLPAWIFYQVFEAYQTAKARRDGLPLPDPLGLNEAVQNLFHQGRPPYPGQPGAGPVNPNPAGAAQANPNPPAQAPGSYQTPPYPGSYQQGSYEQGAYQQGQYQQPPYQAPYSTPFTPPIPPVPPAQWRRREPIAAVVLIALGVLFLMGQFNIFSVRLLHFSWPLLLIGLGAWLIVRRLRDSQGGPQ